MDNWVLGKKLKSLREKNHLTQFDASTMLYMSRRKLIDIEQGKIIPSLEDMYAFSRLYKFDTANFLIVLKKFNSLEIKNAIDSIELKLSDMEYDSLLENILFLKKYKDVNYFIMQYYYAVSGFYYMKSNHMDVHLAIEYLTKMLKINNPDFSIASYDKYSYSNLELRCLVALADCLRYKNDLEIYKTICEFSYKQLYSINTSYFVVSIQYATMKSMLKDYETSSKIVAKCIKEGNKSNNHTYLPFLYYLDYINNKKSEKDSQAEKCLEKALLLCDCYNKKNLKKLILLKK